MVQVTTTLRSQPIGKRASKSDKARQMQIRHRGATNAAETPISDEIDVNEQLFDYASRELVTLYETQCPDKLPELYSTLGITK